MTFGTFKGIVAGFMQRSETSFVVNGVDLLAAAIRQAQRWAERKRNFELSRVQIKVPQVHFQNGAPLSDAVLTSDGTTAVSVKTLLKAFLPFSDGSGFFPVDVVTRNGHVRRLQKNFENWVATDPTAKFQPLPTAVAYFVVVRMADTVYVAPSDAVALGAERIDVLADAVRWLPVLSNTNDTNFLLDFCEDFMLFRSVWQLNQALKEDVRVPVSTEALADSWRSVVEWDSSITLNSAEDASLE